MMSCVVRAAVGGRLQVPVQLYREGDMQVRRQPDQGLLPPLSLSLSLSVCVYGSCTVHVGVRP